MDKVLKHRWIEALRSGDYPKGKRRLKNRDGSYCCLGVLAEIEGDLDKYIPAIERGEVNYSSYLESGSYGLSLSAQMIVAKINDDANTFEDAIEYIERVL